MRSLSCASFACLLFLVLIVPAPAQAQNVDQLIADLAAGWSQHDMERLMTVFTDDVVYEDMAVGVVNRGKTEVRGFVQGFFNAFPDISCIYNSYFTSGNRVAGEWTCSGTQRGDLPGIPATNKFASVRGISMIDLQDGKIKRITDYWDMATMLKQLGVMPSAAK